MKRQRRRSAASRLFAVLLGATALFALAVAALFVAEAQRATRAEAERVTRAVAITLAADSNVQSLLAAGDRAAASARLQPLAEEVMLEARVDFVTIMTADGIRVTHRDRAEIGKRYLGTIPEIPSVLTEESRGTLGPSVRTVAPVDTDGELAGWVSVGVTLDSVAAALSPRIVTAVAIGAAVVGTGLLGAALLGRATRRIAGDLPMTGIRDTLASAESMRTLGEALRAQTHEHGNRMHAAVGLLELGRTDDAIGILTASAQQSQALVDQVTAQVGS